MKLTESPLRVVLAAVGSRGDIQPMLALAQALAARGHTVRIAAPPNFAAWVGGLGFEFAPLGVDMQLFMRENREVLSGNPLNMVKGIRRYFSEQIPLQFDQLLVACDGAQALLFGGAALTAPSVAEYLRLPILGPVYVGFGSMSSSGTDRVGRLLVDAIAATGRRCIVSSGWADLGAGALPHGWRLVQEAPHALLFPRVAGVVHHGGSGTMAAALRAGVPQAIVPHILDQFYFAHRLKTLGLAPTSVPAQRISAPRLLRAVEETLALPAEPRQQAVARLRDGTGLARAIAIIESGAQKRRLQ